MYDAPRTYSRELELAGGLNEFGMPNYILWWTQRPLRDVGTEYVLDPHIGCWALAEWKGAQEFGDPELWDYKTLGPFPSRGRYVSVQPFYNWDTLSPVPLDSFILNPGRLRHMVWVHKKVVHQRLIERKRRQEEIRERENKQTQDKIADILQDSVPAFGDTASYAAQKSTKTVLRQRMEQIEQNLAWSNEFRRRMGKGPVVRKD